MGWIQRVNCPMTIIGYAMIRTCCLLSLICFGSVCFAQAKDAYYGTVITKIDRSDTDADTSRMLYCRNLAGDRLSVYTVTEGVLSEGSAYHLTAVNNGLFCYRRSLTSGEEMQDSISIAFHDKSYAVVINKTDRYTLFPAYYVAFKQEVKTRHSIMALLNLLSDAIGDYPISDALPLLSYTPKLVKQISRARILTQRSQADVKDTWTCNYYYNKGNQLDSISAFSPEEIRFSKQIHYRGSELRSIITYVNIESRQITSRSINYDISSRSTIKWREGVYETGKNRESLISVTLNKNDLGVLTKMEPSKAEVLELLTSQIR